MIPAEDEYLKARVLTASPYRLHLMVIDETIKRVQRVANALDESDFELSNTHCASARESLNELLAGLRTDSAPNLIPLVQDYFLHIQKNLHLADLKQDLEAARNALELLRSYRETWADLSTALDTST